jgi:hypothetical protein
MIAGLRFSPRMMVSKWSAIWPALALLQLVLGDCHVARRRTRPGGGHGGSSGLDGGRHYSSGGVGGRAVLA